MQVTLTKLLTNGQAAVKGNYPNMKVQLKSQTVNFYKARKIEGKFQREVEARARITYKEEEAELAKHQREEKFALSLEEKRLEFAASKRDKTKLPELQISKFQGTHLGTILGTL